MILKRIEIHEDETNKLNSLCYSKTCSIIYEFENEFEEKFHSASTDER